MQGFQSHPYRVKNEHECKGKCCPEEIVQCDEARIVIVSAAVERVGSSAARDGKTVGERKPVRGAPGGVSCECAHAQEYQSA